ncbi:MAG TPA: hypothetical protein VHH34_15550 [Pseudonocardiaceae bacterium]|nr:hypothetical protein [Pseudonocardiaceae bacterium]
MTTPSRMSGGGYDNAPISGQPPPVSATGAAFVVSPDEVLAKHAALLTEADEFQAFLDHIQDRLFMQPCGDDPVSHDVARVVTHRLVEAEGSYFNVCQQWVNNLYQTAEALAETARGYGFTDEDIAAALSRGSTSA